MQPGQQREIAGHHQPLDVVRVGIPPRLPDDLRDAGHLRLAAPVELRQRPRRPQRIQRRRIPACAASRCRARYSRQPMICRMNPSAAFSATAPGPPRRLDRPAHRQRVEQPDIQRRRDHRMEQRSAASRCIASCQSPNPGSRWAMKVGQRRLGILRRHRKAEAVDFAEAVGEALAAPARSPPR